MRHCVFTETKKQPLGPGPGQPGPVLINVALKEVFLFAPHSWDQLRLTAICIRKVCRINVTSSLFKSLCKISTNIYKYILAPGNYVPDNRQRDHPINLSAKTKAAHVYDCTAVSDHQHENSFPWLVFNNGCLIFLKLKDVSLQTMRYIFGFQFSEALCIIFFSFLSVYADDLANTCTNMIIPPDSPPTLDFLLLQTSSSSLSSYNLFHCLSVVCPCN